MFAENTLKHFSRRTGPATGDIVQALTDTFLCIGARGDVQQALVGFCILNNGCCLPIHRQHHGALALFKAVS
jgi:hypothetical protein